jgi:hypothetical protein
MLLCFLLCGNTSFAVQEGLAWQYNVQDLHLLLRRDGPNAYQTAIDIMNQANTTIEFLQQTYDRTNRMRNENTGLTPAFIDQTVTFLAESEYSGRQRLDTIMNDYGGRFTNERLAVPSGSEAYYDIVTIQNRESVIIGVILNQARDFMTNTVINFNLDLQI